MAETESSKIVSQNDSSQKPKNLFSIIPKFELKFPFFNKSVPLAKEETKIAVVSEGGENESGNQKPNIVSFPNARPLITSSIEVEAEESSGRTHNPVIIWQVYALGGFIVVKWLWARWQERNERAKKASSDDNQSNDEYQSPAEED
ncbi:unnamed protein product [Dovyalis caffra]|uniref:Uncharacterized protein n=1 Tax=Dovyalis caffra TaxID=77055 RepID=A0AAV1QYE4_9ROSI|nr:unnamed protein product [Dovyalis caffra]